MKKKSLCVCWAGRPLHLGFREGQPKLRGTYFRKERWVKIIGIYFCCSVGNSKSFLWQICLLSKIRLNDQVAFFLPIYLFIYCIS